MVYATGKFLYLHLPRTGGSAIHKAIQQSTLGAEIVFVTSALGPLRKHSRACEIKPMLGPEWDRLHKFACIRNPFDLAESLYSLFVRPTWMDEQDANLYDYQISFHREVQRFREMTFGEWLRDHLTPIIETGGWWSHFCEQNGHDLGIHPIRYEDLNTEWGKLQNQFGFSDLSHENGATRSTSITWTEADREFVRTGFARDFERFGYA